MINPTKEIEITAIVYLTQLESIHSKHCNPRFYATTVSFKEMCIDKHFLQSISATNPFKVVVRQ